MRTKAEHAAQMRSYRAGFIARGLRYDGKPRQRRNWVFVFGKNLTKTEEARERYGRLLARGLTTHGTPPISGLLFRIKLSPLQKDYVTFRNGLKLLTWFDAVRMESSRKRNRREQFEEAA